MTYRAWMADAERLMNLMESFEYKSEQYNICRAALLDHLAQKPQNQDEDQVTAWTMTGPSPLDMEMPAAFDEEILTPIQEFPAVPVEPVPSATVQKQTTSVKKAPKPKEQASQKPLVAKPKRSKKKSTRKPKTKH